MAFDKTKPQGSIPLKTLDDQCRTNFEAIEDAIDQDHDFTTGGTQTGKHDKVTLKAPLGSKPSLSASEGALYSKDVSAKAELFYEDEDGDEVQLTSGGRLKAITGAGADILRIISVVIEYYNKYECQITISSLRNGDTLVATRKFSDVAYYDFNCSGSCLGVIGVFQTASAKGSGGEVFANIRPWAAALSNGNLRLGICPSYSSPYNTIGELLSSPNQSVTFTVAYLTDA